MKKYSIIFAFIIISFQLFSKTINLKLKDNKGFFSKKEAIYILDKLDISKKKDVKMEYYKNSDTLGRYFKSTETGNYILCLRDNSINLESETPILIELKPTIKNQFELITYEYYFHGNYSCCWKNNFDGFTYQNDFFTINTCGTGSGLCSKHAYYFKHVIPQEQLNPITVEYNFFHELMEAYKLESFVQIAKNQLKISYTLSTYTLKETDIENLEKTLISQEKFDVLYEFKDNNWITNDTFNLQKLDF